MRRTDSLTRFTLAVGLTLAASAVLATTSLSKHVSKSEPPKTETRGPSSETQITDATPRETPVGATATSATCIWLPRNGSFGGPGWRCKSL